MKDRRRPNWIYTINTFLTNATPVVIYLHDFFAKLLSEECLV